ncbi:hypothetical protein AB0C34_01615 [Nocardia sp. NPDC049220]|uniref:hypothetical protein n=1 Tax=Nocardia sp. NPDC049220 TaxID=3155273 RepID=UPI0033C8FB33
MIKIKDLIESEERVDAAEREYRELMKPENWSAHESLDKEGRRHLHVNELTFQRQDQALKRLEAARSDSIALRRAFIEGGVKQ